MGLPKGRFHAGGEKIKKRETDSPEINPPHLFTLNPSIGSS
jgi:hypothetical protein